MTLSHILLQVSIQTNGAEAIPATQEGLSAIDLILKGGWIMVPIAFLLLLSLYFFFERFLYIRKASRMDPTFLSTIKDKLYQGDIKGAIQHCQKSGTPISALIEKGLTRVGSPIRDIESAIENTAKLEIYKMEKNLTLLSAVAAIAPMMGFLGTVIGMIRAFYDISVSDNISIGVISSGIYTKMITSASGLIVGVLAYVFFAYLNTMIDRAIHRMEVVAVEFMDLLHKPVS